MTITQEQFDNLKQGDELSSFGNDLIFEGKVGRIALFINKTTNMVHTHPLVVLIENKYELKIPIPHLQGFPIGDYEDKKVFCAFHDFYDKFLINKDEFEFEIFFPGSFTFHVHNSHTDSKIETYTYFYYIESYFNKILFH